LHLTAVFKLWPHLTRENAPELLKAAEFKTKTEVLQLIAQRFPSTEVLPLVSMSPTQSQAATELVESTRRDEPTTEPLQASRIHASPGPDQVEVRQHVAPIAPQRVEFRFSGSQNAYEKLQY